MRVLLLVFLAALLILPTAAMSLEQILPFGYSYFALPEQVGTAMTVVGFLEPPVGFDYPFTVDFATYEYTYYFEATVQSITPGPITTEILYAVTTFEIYEDAAMNGDYGVAPTSFRDGTLILSGTMSGLVRLDYNFGFPEPTSLGSIDWTAGSKLGELAPYLSGWTFHAGVSTNAMTGIPAGYQQNWSCKIVPPESVPVEDSSWGKVKSLYAD